MIEQTKQFNFLKATREMDSGGYWLLRCNECEFEERKSHFVEVLRMKKTHDLKRSHHVSVDPKPARIV